MRLWIVSDLHIGPGSSWSPSIPQHDVMIIAGDVAADREDALIELINLHGKTGQPIVFVPGNHDLFGGPLDAFDGENRLLLAQEIYVLSSGQRVVIGDVRFVGATLWTDWALGDREFQSQAWAAAHMREYQSITRRGGKPLWPIHTSNAHEMQLAAIRSVLARRHEGPTVVITHHAPSPQSLRPGEEQSVEAAAYASDLHRTMDEYGPDLWVHGHTHRAVDYDVGHTRVVSNPRGYQRNGWSEETGWVEDWVVEV